MSIIGRISGTWQRDILIILKSANELHRLGLRDVISRILKARQNLCGVQTKFNRCLSESHLAPSHLQPTLPKRRCTRPSAMPNSSCVSRRGRMNWQP
jgi:hypothetical protein